MWFPKHHSERKGGNGLVAVAIDKDKNSQNALKWAIDNILQRGQTVVLIHVKLKQHGSNSSTSFSTSTQVTYTNYTRMLISKEPDPQTRELFLPFRCFCSRKDIQCKDIMLEDVDVAKALIEYVSQAAIENLVLGASVKTGFLRFKMTDIPGSVGKGAPDFCNVYVISKGKIQSMRSAMRPAPANSTLRAQIMKQSSPKSNEPQEIQVSLPTTKAAFEKPPDPLRRSYDEIEYFRSPFTSRRGPNGKSYGELPMLDSDISFVSSGRPSLDRIIHPLFNENVDSAKTSPRMSIGTEFDFNHSFESLPNGRRSEDTLSPSEFSSFSQESDLLSSSSPAMEDVEAEMKRLKLELKQTMEMYSTACKEALSAKQKAIELQRWKNDEERRLEEARFAEEAALAIAEKERAKSKAAIEAAEAARRIADLEVQKRVNAELKAIKESEERRKAIEALSKTDLRYRRYSIEEIEAATGFFDKSRKIGEGGYGPVYKCYLDHTPAAIKVLRPDAAQGRSQFQQEVEVLTCIRHPNMVLLLGACPDFGCLVYEFMANGSLEDRLFCRGNTRPLSWQLRFRIAAEIGTGLLFLHQTKPEPLVHRDLKPANILLDRNFVSKISDVGLARLVPPSIADNVTQYRMTSTAGTFCYIDPEYQQTGMLGVKSDIYSLGIMFLQLITAKSAMGLTHHVERAIEKGTFAEMLDPAVPDWPHEEALSFGKLALKCAELRRKDRPDLGNVILPELNRLRALAEDNMQLTLLAGDESPGFNHSQVSVVSLTLLSTFVSLFTITSRTSLLQSLYH
ncbi:U-box domain-containing protein 35 [Humulus lupulus]|uniref:U-box domain-containing protein 35 n=1 Tax=Humulus lupulus TaxID=3486 RepID=UPI002B40D2E2|nr:U-box domain-containing protein 35 [Humulus lupulus]